MEKIPKKLIIVKYGTAVLVSEDNGIDEEIIKEHGRIINEHDNPILMVSSGAVGFGNTLANFDYIEDEVVRKRALASLGNPHLSISWDNAIKDKKVLQALVTHRGLQNNGIQEDLKKIIHSIYNNGNSAIIQFNENDFVSDAELKDIRGGDFGDNDKTTTLIAEICLDLFDEIELIIQTSTDGVLSESGEVIKEISTSELSDEKIEKLCGENKTGTGTGGMKNKLTITRDLIEKKPQIVAYIIDGKNSSQFEKILNNEITWTKILK